MKRTRTVGNELRRKVEAQRKRDERRERRRAKRARRGAAVLGAVAEGAQTWRRHRDPRAIALAERLVDEVERAMLACDDPSDLARLRLELMDLRRLASRPFGGSGPRRLGWRDRRRSLGQRAPGTAPC
jgi:hypothetical protein